MYTYKNSKMFLEESICDFVLLNLSFRCIVERKTCLSVTSPCPQYYCGKKPFASHFTVTIF